MRTLPALMLVLIRMSLGTRASADGNESGIPCWENAVTQCPTWESCGALAGLVITRPELKADVGDSVLLECVFLSLVEGDWNVTKVDWVHLPENSTQKEKMVFYYYSNWGVPVRHGVQWLGDVAHKNSSIKLQDVQVNDSGTYTCEIRVFGRSSIFKNHTVLHVASVGQRLHHLAGPQDPEITGSGGWKAMMGYLCAAIFLALLLGYGLKKFLQKQRPMENGTLLRTRGDGNTDKLKEGICSLPSCPEMLKAGQEAEWCSRKDAIYITMHPSAAFHGAGFAPLEHNVYVQLERKKIPVEWMDEGRPGDEGAQQSEKTHEKSDCQEDKVPCALEGGRPSLAQSP